MAVADAVSSAAAVSSLDASFMVFLLVVL